MIKRLLFDLIQRKRKSHFFACGDRVRIGRNCHFQGQVYIGNNVSVGNGAYFVSTRAKLIIHDNVVIGPNVTIYTGDHPTDIIGKHLIDITDSDKDARSSNYDKDVVIESGCWIGTRAIILKGVTIGRGSVIGAGAVVTKPLPPYSVYVGVPAAKFFPRFSESQIIQHEQTIMVNGGKIDSMLGKKD